MSATKHIQPRLTTRTPPTAERRRNSVEGGALLRTFVELDRVAMGPDAERLTVKSGAYARLHP
ncbi:hypothetical protein GCM10010372_04670 [Streptomyces tauricus]|nr:hypothetical protein GCM10010372_04670 [Streptomyces tauricus]